MTNGESNSNDKCPNDQKRRDIVSSGNHSFKNSGETMSANSAAQKVKITFGERQAEYPVIVGTENELAFDVSKLRADTGLLSLDEGYRNTAAVQSAISFIDGEKGILRYRGIPIEELAEKISFIETALLLIYGELPTAAH